MASPYRNQIALVLIMLVLVFVVGQGCPPWRYQDPSNTFPQPSPDEDSTPRPPNAKDAFFLSASKPFVFTGANDMVALTLTGPDDIREESINWRILDVKDSLGKSILNESNPDPCAYGFLSENEAQVCTSDSLNQSFNLDGAGKTVFYYPPALVTQSWKVLIVASAEITGPTTGRQLPDGEFELSSFELTVRPPAGVLSVSLTADPVSIVVPQAQGDSKTLIIQTVSALEADISGGTPLPGSNPYDVKWFLVARGGDASSGGLLLDDQQSTSRAIIEDNRIVARYDVSASSELIGTRQYLIEVTDAAGTIARGVATVNIEPTLSVLVSTVKVGVTWTLTANALGGLPPHRFFWSNSGWPAVGSIKVPDRQATGDGPNRTVNQDDVDPTRVEVLVVDSVGNITKGSLPAQINPTCIPPTITSHPQNVLVGDDPAKGEVEVESVEFRITVSSSANGGAPQFQWQYEVGSGVFVDLSEGSAPGSSFQGLRSARLEVRLGVLTLPPEADSRFRCRVTDQCEFNGVFSNAAFLDLKAPEVASMTPSDGETRKDMPSVIVTFDEPVAGVAAADLTVEGDSATSVSSPDGRTFTFSGFTQPSDGNVSITLDTDNIVDGNGRELIGDGHDDSITWHITINSNAPTIASVTPPNGTVFNGAAEFPATFTVEFDEGVRGVTAGALKVIASNTPAGSPATGVVASVEDPLGSGHFRVYVFSGYTHPADGPIQVTLNGTGVLNFTDLPAPTLSTWSYTQDTADPRVQSIVASPREGDTIGPLNAGNFMVTVTFTEGVTGVDDDDLEISWNGGAQTATGVINVAASTASTYVWHNFTASPSAPSYMTGVTMTLLNTDNDIHDTRGNPLQITAEAVKQYTVDLTPTDVSIVPDGGSSPATRVTIDSLSIVSLEFARPVSNVNKCNLLVKGAPALNSQGAGSGPYLFTVTSPGSGDFEITLLASCPPAGLPIVDNLNVPIETRTWYYRLDDKAPEASIFVDDRLAIAGETTVFLVRFSERVTGFGDESPDHDLNDVDLIHSGTAGGEDNVTIMDMPGGDPQQDYEVHVSNITGDGSYRLKVRQGVATEVGGTKTNAEKLSEAITVRAIRPAVTPITHDAGVTPKHSGQSVVFSVVFSENVSGFDTAGQEKDKVTITHSHWGDVTDESSTQITITKHPPSPQQTNYRVTVTGIYGDLTGGGTYTLRINAGAATDVDGNTNEASAESPVVNVQDQATLRFGEDQEVLEGDTGDSPRLTFTLELSNPVGVAITRRVSIQMFVDQAEAGSDFVDFPGGFLEVTIPAGETTAEFDVEVIGDEDVEPDEYFGVVYTVLGQPALPAYVTLGVGSPRGTILNDD